MNFKVVFGFRKVLRKEKKILRKIIFLVSWKIKKNKI